MSETESRDRDYCSHLVRTQDEDRWLAVQYARGPLQAALMTLAALRSELRRIPAQVSEPPLGEIRLQWWREGLGAVQAGAAPPAHPVLEAVAATIVGEERWAAQLDAVIDASARPLYGEDFSSADDLAGWLLETEGALDALAVSMAGGDPSLAEAATRAGAAFSMAREGKMLAPKLAAETREHAMQLYKETAPALSKAPPQTAPALLHLSLTPFYLREGPRRAPLYKRLRLFVAMAFARF